MTTAIMAQTQVFIGLNIVDDNRLLFRPLVPITTIFFFLMSLYRQWLEVKELLNAVLYLLDSLGMVLSPYLDFSIIVIKSLAFGIGVRL